jgi:hypothetical protein
MNLDTERVEHVPGQLTVDDALDLTTGSKGHRMELITVRAAVEDDLPYVMALQRANRESVGGLPSPALAERITRRTLALASINDDPVGYLLYDLRDGVLRIAQACIQYDARRRTYGEQLWLWVMNRHGAGIHEARLRCAADIDANVFWQGMGFTCLGVVPGGARRGRLINLWQQWFGERTLFTVDEFEVSPAAQIRQDCHDEQTGFLTSAPEGFIAAGALPKLAWSNRKPLELDRL